MNSSYSVISWYWKHHPRLRKNSCRPDWCCGFSEFLWRFWLLETVNTIFLFVIQSWQHFHSHWATRFTYTLHKQWELIKKVEHKSFLTWWQTTEPQECSTFLPNLCFSSEVTVIGNTHLGFLLQWWDYQHSFWTLTLQLLLWTSVIDGRCKLYQQCNFNWHMIHPRSRSSSFCIQC